jgi:hypothetical protein
MGQAKLQFKITLWNPTKNLHKHATVIQESKLALSVSLDFDIDPIFICQGWWLLAELLVS